VVKTGVFPHRIVQLLYDLAEKEEKAVENHRFKKWAMLPDNLGEYES